MDVKESNLSHYLTYRKHYEEMRPFLWLERQYIEWYRKKIPTEDDNEKLERFIVRLDGHMSARLDIFLSISIFRSVTAKTQ